MFHTQFPPPATMTRSIALTKMVSEAEVTTEQKHQRVVAWLTEVNRVLYRNVDLTVHAPRVFVYLPSKIQWYFGGVNLEICCII